ncbi:MAG: hypothetical protein AB8G05_27090 [Oligoflexales bacterium]
MARCFSFKKNVGIFILILAASLACKRKIDQYPEDEAPLLQSNSPAAKPGGENKEKDQLDLLVGESGLLSQFKLTEDDSEGSADDLVDAIVLVPADDQIPDAFKAFCQG